ncbi:MAG: hypothetical protein DRQ78_06930 [Epsilonproteobacteria bacterium]|nr:MAG: hypothetical protein DRQ78_06930 [Campylobacterota bacterium]
MTELNQTNKYALSSKKAAAYLSINEQTLRKSRGTGLLFNIKAPIYKKVGRRVFYLTIVLEDWVNNIADYSNTKNKLNEEKMDD